MQFLKECRKSSPHRNTNHIDYHQWQNGMLGVLHSEPWRFRYFDIFCDSSGNPCDIVNSLSPVQPVRLSFEFVWCLREGTVRISCSPPRLFFFFFMPIVTLSLSLIVGEFGFVVRRDASRQFIRLCYIFHRIGQVVAKEKFGGDILWSPLMPPTATL